VGSESSSRVSGGGSKGSGEESNTSGATWTTVDECRGLGHVTLKELPEKRHKDGDFSFEDREGEELERERGVTEREETAIEALQQFYLTLNERTSI